MIIADMDDLSVVAGEGVMAMTSAGMESSPVTAGKGTMAITTASK